MLALKVFKELFIGTILVLLGMIILISISNGVGIFLSKFKIPIIIVFLIHIFIIIGCLYILRISISKIIIDKEMFNSIFVLVGPIITAASFYFSPFVKKAAKKILKENVIKI
jgi:hypothetical protein